MNGPKDTKLNRIETAAGTVDHTDNLHSAEGDDFDEFEQGDEAEDFGAFDDGVEGLVQPTKDQNKSSFAIPHEPLVSPILTLP